MVNPPTVTPDPGFANYAAMLGMPAGGTGTSAANPAVAQGGVAAQQPGAGPSAQVSNPNYMQPYWLQQPSMKAGISAGSLMGAAGGGGGSGGCD